MRILHTVTCTRFSPSYRAHVECTKSLTRNRRLSDAGIQRILNAADRENNGGKKPTHPLNVVRVETAIYQ